ncbi:hypothetical protein dsx2_3161 [Desulfovibrio sp. X2]|uniref:hypothetical protein n=1 Tax=Desulfovibrio sp. X2 TaxID=941449 RepID=UPI000358B724|nr:hypothetical protein [Desulfovibrio sp. X2]EPR41503.1 hypothetical protein dsx2_3161 [Desulfovibrio sp. X2]
MDVVFQAFQWNLPSPDFSSEKLLDFISKENGWVFGQRYFYAVPLDNCWAGLVLTVRDAKRFATLEKKGEQIIVTSRQLEEGSMITDFNFFVFCQGANFGIYQHYNKSCSLNQFNLIVKKFYNERREVVKKNIEENVVDRKIRDEKLRNLSKKFTYSIIERPGHFHERIGKLKDIKSVEYEYLTFEQNENRYVPLSGVAKRIRHHVSLSKAINAREKLAEAVDFFKEKVFKKALVKGIDPENNEIVYKLVNDFDRIAEFDYDDLVVALAFNSSDIVKSISENLIVKRLRHEIFNVEKLIISLI